MPKITYDEWRAALEAAMAEGKRDDDGLRVEEICEIVGRTIEWVRGKIIRPGLANGTIRRGRRMITRIDGRAYPIPVYQIVKKAK